MSNHSFLTKDEVEEMERYERIDSRLSDVKAKARAEGDPFCERDENFAAWSALVNEKNRIWGEVFSSQPPS